ncbi:MAG: hypothetical protein E5X23_09310 [Mesorhizobium sp.]|uniref:hypothetical protein n=2 Tax=Mesorhizobium TaxID=68287 RepID=UPI000FCB4A99|nr:MULTISPECIES: hypothetical protein [unclassified Mesorhizobium]TGV93662.1 hypothetical protein EN801_011535 [Mesorhizobium sp. M00.F.Ca.ET.158.01.1.1]MCT2577676.1 hypothetical protein [Mesorhizobium sp. P13.3]MDF3166614.1 hypothetical protein [Mesorhizobium sp. P16.1]MDF3179382.1 hypothetical protein [Mesorhizobium sp. P17.1]MDF3183274.1 hypothetical protein [Mesorhizobium sp. ICCV3110.1]
MSIARKLAAARRMLADATAILAEIEVEAEQEKSSSPTWVETGVAAEALGIPLDSVRNLCRQKGYGRKRGGRWEADIGALRTYFAKRDNRDETHRVSSRIK